MGGCPNGPFPSPRAYLNISLLFLDPPLSPPDSTVALTSLERKGSSPHSSFVYLLSCPISPFRARLRCAYVRKSKRKKYLLCLLRAISPPLFLYRARRYDTRFATDEGVYMDHPRRQERASQKRGDGGRLRGNEGCWTNVFRSLSPLGFSLFRRRPNPRHFFLCLHGGKGRDRQSSLYRL